MNKLQQFTLPAEQPYIVQAAARVERSITSQNVQRMFCENCKTETNHRRCGTSWICCCSRLHAHVLTASVRRSQS
jgi:hypothetical protein